MRIARKELPGAILVTRVLGICAIALATANCSSQPQRYASHGGRGGGIDPKYGVSASPRLYTEGQAIPKGGGRRFAGKPYAIAGRTYVPQDDAKGYVREGLASWYGAAFHGRKTANGEVFDRHSVAAAHPTLPLPSYARVTNLNNGHSMIVRVNDRGPYHANRVMDVSEEVARTLDFHRKGTERVRVEYVGKASIAGSDDRKLMATLRTDGRPAGISGGSPVMVADLGQDVANDRDRFVRPEKPALAFKPSEPDGERARPVYRAPPMAVASVAVPPAIQPTGSRHRDFVPPAGDFARSNSTIKVDRPGTRKEPAYALASMPGSGATRSAANKVAASPDPAPAATKRVPHVESVKIAGGMGLGSKSLSETRAQASGKPSKTIEEPMSARLASANSVPAQPAGKSPASSPVRSEVTKVTAVTAPKSAEAGKGVKAAVVIPQSKSLEQTRATTAHTAARRRTYAEAN